MIKTFSQNNDQYDKANQKLRIAIVRSSYHDELTKNMEQACRQYLIASGVMENHIKTFEVPGSWEIPLVVKNLAKSKKFDGILTFGVIIKGKTFHFELIAMECARALMNIALEFNIPVTFEVLAVYNLQQAKKRSIGKYNKGIEAAETVLKTIRQLSNL